MTVTPKQLNKTECDKLRAMLRSDEFKNLLRVLMGEKDAKQIEAAQAGLKAKPENNYAVAGLLASERVLELDHCIGILTEQRKNAVPETSYFIVAIEPTMPQL